MTSREMHRACTLLLIMSAVGICAAIAVISFVALCALLFVGNWLHALSALASMWVSAIGALWLLTLEMD